MTRLRIQFTLRGMLWATFWVALSTQTWLVFHRPQTPHSVLPFLAYIFGFITGFGALGALFGQTRTGLELGLFVGFISAYVFQLAGVAGFR